MTVWLRSYAGLLLAITALAGLQSTPENLSDHDVAVIQELYHLWSSKSESIWPGVSKLHVPILYIKSNSEYAVQFPHQLNGFVPVRTPSEHAGRATRDRNAFYHLGMGKALALDRVDPRWKKQYFAARVWLDDLLHISMDGSK